MKVRFTLLIAASFGITAAPLPLVGQQAGSSSWVVGSTGNAAQYRVREQLAGVAFENDAVGITNDITGEIQIDADGRVVAATSRITVGLAGLESDKPRRDGYLARRTLEIAQYPEASLAVSAFEGLPQPIPTTGTARFVLLGDLTLKERTLPTRWEVAATFEDGHVTGTATTSFTFDEAGLDKPSVMAVLSVKDPITLEYRFHFVSR